MQQATQGKEIGRLTLKIEPDVLREIISNGRLSEFATVASAEAAAQISAQLVDQVAAASLSPERLGAGAEVSLAYVLEGGDFGTRVPGWPRPHVGGGVIVVQSFLQRTVPSE